LFVFFIIYTYNTGKTLICQEKREQNTKKLGKKSILDVENVNMLGINADNVDEVISENA